MEKIYEPNDSFDFSKLSLLSPSSMPGGNYFIKFRINDSPLYIQPPKCVSKSAIFKSGKKHYCDLMFTNENEDFIRWMENLENYCQKKIFGHRSKWFETELDEHDIENSFTSPLKIFKSGKFYISRTNVPTMLGKCSLKIYNEDEHEVDIETIKENTNVVTILEIQGIKCSSKNFQIEIEIKQMMVFKQNNLFEKCIFTANSSELRSSELGGLPLRSGESAPSWAPNTTRTEPNMEPTTGMKIIEKNGEDGAFLSNRENNGEHSSESFEGFDEKRMEQAAQNENDNNNIELIISEIDEENNSLEKQINIPDDSAFATSPIFIPEARYEDIVHDTETFVVKRTEPLTTPDSMLSDLIKTEQKNQTTNEINISSENNETHGDSKDILEVNMNIDDLPNGDTVFIKKRNDIYYQMYKEAKRKAKMARDLAISSYLEAKHIKNTYMLENEDSDSDFDEESFDNME